MLAVSANLSMLFGERSFLQRFAAAAEAGFAAVEFMFPYAEAQADVVAACRSAGVSVVLFNLPAGDWAAGDRGIAADPDRVDEFRRGIDVARAWADALGCPQLNCLAGRGSPHHSAAACRATLVENVRYAATALARDGRRLLVEAVNLFDVPGFVLPRADAAAALLAEAGEPTARVQFDFYHEQRFAGNVTETFQRLAPQVGHVQVADCPGRHQPGSGELNWPFLLRAVETAGYTGHVGLEYVPEPDTVTSLRGLRALGFAV